MTMGVGTAKAIKFCDKCGEESQKLYSTFGKMVCPSCKENRPNKGMGNSGMKDLPQGLLFVPSGLSLVKVSKSSGLFGNLYFSHYPGSRGIVGRTLCYIIYYDNDVAGIIGCSSPPRGYKAFSGYFGENTENLYVNNNVFRLINHEKNLGTKVLKIFRNTIRQDYRDKYGDDLLGIVTFVELPRTGSIYKADNWDYLGLTQGKRMRRDPCTWEKTFTDGLKKHIYGYKYREKK